MIFIFFRIKHENTRMIFESTEPLRRQNCSITSFSTGYKEVIISFYFLKKFIFFENKNNLFMFQIEAAYYGCDEDVDLIDRSGDCLEIKNNSNFRVKIAKRTPIIQCYLLCIEHL